MNQGIVFSVFILLIVTFILWPPPIDPIAWSPPEDDGFEGAFSLNETLKQHGEQLFLSDGAGPEDVAVDESGFIYGGLHDGRIIRFSPSGDRVEVFTTIEGGRPLGLHFDAAGNLIVADAWKGLLSVNSGGEVTVLSTEADGVPFAFADDLDIASDGKIYFSDASFKYQQPDYRLDILEGRPNGRLLVYDPKTEVTTTLLSDLYFANGIALSRNEDFVLVNETGRYRIARYWLKGDKAGSHDIFIDNLPGFPDGVSSNRAGVFWLAMPSPRNPALDGAHPSPWLKKLLAKLPVWLQPSAIRQGSVVALDETGKVLFSLHDSLGERVYMVTSVEQVGDHIYLGSLEAPQIVKLDVSTLLN